MLRTELIGFRATAEEAELWRKVAAKHERTISDFGRWLLRREARALGLLPNDDHQSEKRTEEKAA